MYKKAAILLLAESRKGASTVRSRSLKKKTGLFQILFP